jgi:hypothetical protein
MHNEHEAGGKIRKNDAIDTTRSENVKHIIHILDMRMASQLSIINFFSISYEISLLAINTCKHPKFTMGHTISALKVYLFTTEQP